MTTERDATATLLRLTLGLVIFPHGAQLALGWWGGPGAEAALSTFKSIGVPAALGVLVIAAQFLGGLGLIAGFLGRIAAAGVAAVMAGAIVLGGHLRNGLFMNWFGNQQGEGFEFHLLAISIALAVLVRGSGALSLDRVLSPTSAGSPRAVPREDGDQMDRAA